MKKLVQKLAILWMSILSISGFAKSKTAKPVADQKDKIAKQRVILLDEFELSSYHSN